MILMFWIFILAGTAGVIYTIVNILGAVPAGFALFGWGMFLLCTAIASIYRQKWAEARDLIYKARQQNNEFAHSLIKTLQSQSEQIQQLNSEKLFLMLTVENYSKKGGDDNEN